jgi:hypothetical protein
LHVVLLRALDGVAQRDDERRSRARLGMHERQRRGALRFLGVRGRRGDRDRQRRHYGRARASREPMPRHLPTTSTLKLSGT